MSAIIPTAAILIGLFSAWLATQIRVARIKRAAQMASEVVYSATGGARLDFFNATIPFATLMATSTSISLVVVGREYRFTRDQVRNLVRHDALFSTGLRIEHGRTDYPTLVVFWTWNLGQVRLALEAKGYVVRGAP